MRNLFLPFLLLMIISCSNNKGVYWCGDHPCINKKEKEAYFKKTMIVEIKKLDKKDKKSNSEIEKIIQQAKADEKKRIKKEKNLAQEAKLEEKRRIKEQKALKKQAKLEEKRRIKEQKALEKQAKLKKKRSIEEEKNLAKKIKHDEKKIIKEKKIKPKQSAKVESQINDATIDSSNFNKLVEKIINKNTPRDYPDINDIPD